MNVRELAKLVGHTGQLQSPRVPFTIDVKVLDARTTYGAVHIEVRPVAGRGSGWVALDSVILDPEVNND